MPELVKKNDPKEGQVFQRRPDRALVNIYPLGKLIRSDNEPGKMQVNLDPSEFEKPNGALHLSSKLKAN